MSATLSPEGNTFPANASSSLIQDIELYHRLSRRMPLPPLGYMLPHLDVSAAADLCDRYAIDTKTWSAFRDAVSKRYPDIRPRPSTVAADGGVSDSVPLAIIHESLKSKLTPDVFLVLEPLSLIEAGGLVAGFGLVGQSGMLFVAIVGAVGSSFLPLTKVGRESMVQLEKKLAIFQSARIRRLVAIYTDEVCRVDHLESAIEHVLIKVKEGDAS